MAWAWLVHGSGMGRGWGLAAALASNRMGGWAALAEVGGWAMVVIILRLDWVGQVDNRHWPGAEAA